MSNYTFSIQGSPHLFKTIARTNGTIRTAVNCHDGTWAGCHSVNECSAGDPNKPVHNCMIHCPSLSDMHDWGLHLDRDRRSFDRVCSHGNFHPDPDDLEYDFYMKTGGVQYLQDRLRIHAATCGCYCCAKTLELVWRKLIDPAPQIEHTTKGARLVW